jgi:hypothetical protein
MLGLRQYFFSEILLALLVSLALPLYVAVLDSKCYKKLRGFGPQKLALLRQQAAVARSA